MFHNRIEQNRLQSVSWAQSVAPGGAAPAGLVAVPIAMAQASLHAQLYKIAYERALADLAGPRYLTRFFSVWN